jgi:ComF family protein
MGWFLSHLQQLADLVIPDGCAGCGGVLATAEGPWCVSCAMTLARAARADYCPRCGASVAEPANLADGCSRCRHLRLACDGIARIGEYDGLLKDVVHAYKYGRRQHLAAPLGELLASAMRRHPWLCDLDAIVPVPTGWRSRWRYSFSPPTCLARRVGRLLQLPVLPILREQGKPRPQASLHSSERQRNVRDKYHLRRGANPVGGTCCLVDDVATTLATLQEISGVLKDHGVTAVYAAVIARTPPDRLGGLG